MQPSESKMAERLVTFLVPHLAHYLWPVTRWISGALVVPCFLFKSGENQATHQQWSLKWQPYCQSSSLMGGNQWEGKRGKALSFPSFAGKGEVPMLEVRAQTQEAQSCQEHRLHSRSVRHACGPGICELGKVYSHIQFGGFSCYLWLTSMAGMTAQLWVCQALVREIPSFCCSIVLTSVQK